MGSNNWTRLVKMQLIDITNNTSRMKKINYDIYCISYFHYYLILVVAESIVDFNKEMERSGQCNQAYNSDFCDSIEFNSLSDSVTFEKSVEDYSNTDVKEVISADTEATWDSNTNVKEIISADTEANSSPNQERSVFVS